MNTRIARLILACLLFSLLTAAPILHAQDATPEATVDPETESTQVIEAPNAPGAEEAETDSAIGAAPVTSGQQPGDISSGASDETPVSPVSGATDATEEAVAPTSIAEETPEAGETGVAVEEEAAPEAEAEQPAGVSTLVLLLGIGAVFAVGLLTLARDRFQNNGTDDTTTGS